MKEKLIRGFRRALGAHREADLASYVETGRGRLPAGGSLLTWNLDSVHDYVFDSGNAAAIRGASLILKELDEGFKEGLGAEKPILPIAPEQILYAGGGGGMAVVASDELETIKAALHHGVTSKTVTATCSVASAPLDGGTFREVKASLYRELARSRTLTGADATVPMHFFEEPCMVCGRRAAAIARPRKSMAQRMECVLCFDRIATSKATVESSSESSGFEHIQAASGELGVIYLDGNRMGETLAALGSPLDYARFSAALGRGMTRVVGETIRRYGLKEHLDREGDHRESHGRGYQLPIQGGDDLVIIVPGDVAVPMARDLLVSFENMADGDAELRELSKHRLGASAGVAIGRLPIRHLLDESEAFLESAKTRIYLESKAKGRQRQGSPDHRPLRSCLDFGVLADGRPRRSSHEAPRLAAERSPSSELLFSAKPYSLPELDELDRRRRRFHDGKGGVATSQLHACWTQAQAGPGQLRNHLLYQVGRLDSWRRLVCGLAGSQTPLSDADAAYDALIPTYGGRRVFDIADMLELKNLWREPERKEPLHEPGS